MDMAVFSSLGELVKRFKALGARTIVFKPLEENDNRKQQIYVGDSLEAVYHLPTQWRCEKGTDGDIQKSDLNLRWVDATKEERAPEAKLIFYPQYPEVRLSGILSGCRLAPREHLQPVAKLDRKGYDERVLFLGISSDGRVVAHLAPAGSALSAEARGIEEQDSLFTQVI